MKRIIIFLLCIILPLSLVSCAPSAPSDPQPISEYVTTVPSATLEMQSAKYWISKDPNANDLLMTQAQIQQFNQLNSKLISYDGGEAFALSDVLETMDGAIVRALLSAVFPEDPAAVYLNGQPTTAAYWDALKKNQGLESIGDSVTVKFGYSVCYSNLRSFPTDDFLSETPDDRKVDLATRSDFLPYRPLVVLHESVDEQWYYVQFSGYAGWVRKEYVALCDSREDWLARQAEDVFLLVTGLQLRLPDNPFTP